MTLSCGSRSVLTQLKNPSSLSPIKTDFGVIDYVNRISEILRKLISKSWLPHIGESVTLACLLSRLNQTKISLFLCMWHVQRELDIEESYVVTQTTGIPRGCAFWEFHRFTSTFRGFFLISLNLGLDWGFPTWMFSPVVTRDKLDV